ncbi:MAG: hypothetical protein IT180_09870 [Acidobacteria bacterium]|nr:hypothetical protein [Acidobacteriota bacterium]
MSNLGKWDEWYRGTGEKAPYGDTESYRIGADFLEDCETVEDWGCGRGWFANFRSRNCVGIDGSHSPFADLIVDLETYTSDVDGIFMRHVLEHNYQWRTILANAVASFRKKMVLAIFTPWSEGDTREIRFVERVGVPDISFRQGDIVEMLQGLDWELRELRSEQVIYGQEHVFLIQRPAPHPEGLTT